ncbi:MAG: hypothetical protein LBU11_05415 [Zoogloeaceae bacterium]|jgi:hypothetical protein|nr:hypothetical protein [Zoogloeaceae bacterium]
MIQRIHAAMLVFMEKAPASRPEGIETCYALRPDMLFACRDTTDYLS